MWVKAARHTPNGPTVSSAFANAPPKGTGGPAKFNQGCLRIYLLFHITQQIVRSVEKTTVLIWPLRKSLSQKALSAIIYHYFFVLFFPQMAEMFRRNSIRFPRLQGVKACCVADPITWTQMSKVYWCLCLQRDCFLFIWTANDGALTQHSSDIIINIRGYDPSLVTKILVLVLTKTEDSHK